MADHVVNGLENNDRGPSETIKHLIRQEFNNTEQQKNSTSVPRESSTQEAAQNDNSPQLNEIESNNKSLLRFITGKLFKKFGEGKASEDLVLNIMIDIADLITELYCDKNSLLPFEVFSNFMEDLTQEIQLTDKETDFLSPVLAHLHKSYLRIVSQH